MSDSNKPESAAAPASGAAPGCCKSYFSNILQSPPSHLLIAGGVLVAAVTVALVAYKKLHAWAQMIISLGLPST